MIQRARHAAYAVAIAASVLFPKTGLSQVQNELGSGSTAQIEESFAASLRLPANPFLLIDLNRDAIIDRLVTFLAPAINEMSPDSLRRELFKLRADALVAVSAAQSPGRALELIAGNSLAAVRLEGAKALGEIDRDLVYTPLTPCNLMDTRAGVTPVPPEGGPKLLPGYVVRDVQITGRCGVPSGAVAVSAQFTSEDFPALGGVIFAGKTGTPGGSAVVSWRSPSTYASGGAVVPVSLAGSMQLQSANFTDLKLDINGYFLPPNRAGNGLRVIQTNDGVRPDSPIVINGSAANTASGVGSAVLSGGYSLSNCTDPEGAIGYHCNNQASGILSLVGGGYANEATAFVATVIGGQSNVASGASASVFGGQKNIASGGNTVIVGGNSNRATGNFASVVGGVQNIASGDRSVVSGGSGNNAGGADSWAGGTRAFSQSDAAGTVKHAGAFVWGDNTSADFYSTADNQFAVRATGGVRFISSVSPLAGVQLAPGGGSFISLSDRSTKRNVSAVNPIAILNKVISLPISTWGYLSQDKSIRHIGPMSQDFMKAFKVGETDKGITTVDADGVALAAIQGLNQKLTLTISKRDAEIAKLRKDLEAIKAKLGL